MSNSGTRRIAAVLSDAQIQAILIDPVVIQKRAELVASAGGQVSFSLALPDDVKGALQAAFGLDLTPLSQLPMRWFKGDSPSHIDAGAGQFDNTYIVYLTDSAGAFIVGGDSYPLEKGAAFVFQEGLRHETIGTDSALRLSIGPFNESGLPVGAAILYFTSLSDASSNTNAQYNIAPPYDTILANSALATPFTPPGGTTFGGWITYLPNTTDPTPQSTYAPGDVVPSTGGFPNYTYFLYANWVSNVPCFLEGSTLLCLKDEKEEYVPIEQIRPGTLVKTSLDGFKAVEMIGHTKLYNPGNDMRAKHRLYRCPVAAYPELKQDLFITGCHAILEDELTDEQRADTTGYLGQIYVTDRKYRLMACLDKRAEPWAQEGVFTIWHLALEHKDYYMNYGVYANGGLLVETTSRRYMKELSGMTLV